MIRTTCPKCGREDAVADYLAMLPIMCNGCGTRVTIGEHIAGGPLFPPPVAPPPPPVQPAPPAPPTVKKAVPPPFVEAKPTPLVPPPPPVRGLISEAVSPPVEMATVGVSSPLFITADMTPAAPPPVSLAPEPAPPTQDTPHPAAPPPVGTVPRPPEAQSVAPEPAAVQLQPETPFPLPLAGAGRRLLARFLFLVGLVLAAGLGFGLLVLGGPALKRDLSKDPLLAGAVTAAFPLIYLLVNAVMLARTGQDIGKRYAGVRVVNADGSKATEMNALLKRDALTFVIGLTGIGVLYWLADFVTLFSKGGRTLHDRIAGTRVVRA